MKYRLLLIAITAMLALSQKPAQAQIVASVSLQTANCSSSNDTLLYVIQGITLNSNTVILQLAQGSSTGTVVATPPPGEFVVETIFVPSTPHTNYTYFLLEGVPPGVTTISTPIPYVTVSTTTKNCS